MPQLFTYRLFISHSWNYGDAYEKLVSMLNSAPFFQYANYSVPKDDPVYNARTDRELYEAIKSQIRPVNCVLILAGVYATYSKWIDKEIKIAKQDLNKPVIAIEPFASKKTSTIVKSNANTIVKWNTQSIVDAIRQYSIHCRRL